MSEEHHIGSAIRKLKELNPSFVVEVINACNVSVASKLFSASTIIRNAPVVLKVLTHADLLSDDALRYQMAQAQRHDKRAAVIALDLTNASKIKLKSLQNVSHALLGGARLASTQTAVVCGLPNAGKSSFILPLTQHRTLKIRKKKQFHLPKIAPKAGWTLFTKKHYLEVKGGEMVTLIDTPGLRPKMEHVDDIQTTALLIASGAMEPVKGMMNGELQGVIVDLILKALNRHGSFTPSLPYVETLGLDAPTEDPVEFTKAYQNIQSLKGAGLVLDLVRKCKTGHFGGLIFEQAAGRHDGNEKLSVNRNMPVVCMNDEAKRLIDIGMGRVVPTPLPPPNKPLTKKPNSSEGQPSAHCANDAPRKPTTDRAVREGNTVSDKKTEIVMLPEYQRDIECLKCAGFIKRTTNDNPLEFCGKRHERILGWDEHGIRSYYSRMLEAFGGLKSHHKNYLMRDSLACTLAAKYKLSSRRKVYKKFSGKNLGGYPVPNEERPRHFQSDQPVPLRIGCTNRAKSSCKNRAEYEKAGSQRLCKVCKS